MKNINRGRFSDKAVMIISVSVVILLCLSIFVIAEFTKSSRAKRVIATNEGAGMLFSSNYLSANTTLDNATPKVYRRKIYATHSGQAASGIITVCNYAQGNPTKVYDGDITYTLTAKLVVLSEGNNGATKRDATAADFSTPSESVTIDFGGDSATEVTLDSTHLSCSFGSKTLSGMSSVTHIYNVVFSDDFNDNNSNLALYVCATPTTNSLAPLDSAFTTDVSSTKNKWQGELNENTANATPADFDGFNYLISGSGSGTFTLFWDESRLQISQVFLNDYSLTPETDTSRAGWKKISLTVDSDTKDRYELQFYYVQDVSFSSWGDLESCIDWEYEEAAETTPETTAAP